jgi:carbamoyl-phosphate synthase small subunit
VVGEVVFNTAMTGYQEILTDPSYKGQIVCLTVAEVGNVGCNDDDVESRLHGAEGLVVRSLSPVVSSWRATESLPEMMQRRGLPGIAEIDTRALTRHLRTAGAVTGALSTEGTSERELVELARRAPSMEGRALAHEVSARERVRWDEPVWRGPAPPTFAHVVVYDFGIKLNILRHLRSEGLAATVVPSSTSVAEVLALAPDGVLLSNGPGDPAALPEVVGRVRELLERAPQLPVFGICLGHQLLCLALGGRTYKLKFGHHGGNHPVRAEAGGSTGSDAGARAAVEITAQNHGFAADASSLPRGAACSRTNLFDDTVAGLRLHDRPVMSVQYHPEASPGPHDASHLFAEFAALVRASKGAHAGAT